MRAKTLKLSVSCGKSLRIGQTIAALTLAVAATGLTVPPARAGQPPDVSLGDGFGRMFRLPPFAPPTDAVRNALVELGKPGGLMDAKDDLEAGPIALILDPNLSLINRNNPTHTAGVTFFGQFLDHDMAASAERYIPAAVDNPRRLHS